MIENSLRRINDLRGCYIGRVSVSCCLAERTDDVTDGEPLPDTDLVFLAADSVPELSSLPDLRSRIRPNGAIWVISRKGRAATLRYAELLETAQASGLVDNKVASFSETHTALRFVIPVALRPRP